MDKPMLQSIPAKDIERRIFGESHPQPGKTESAHLVRQLSPTGQVLTAQHGRGVVCHL